MSKLISRGGAVWSARMAHNHQVAGSNPAPATKKNSHRKMAIFLGSMKRYLNLRLFAFTPLALYLMMWVYYK